MKFFGGARVEELEASRTGGRTKGAKQAAGAATGDETSETMGEAAALCGLVAAGQVSAFTATAVVSLTLVPGTGGGFIIAGAVVSGDLGSHAFRMKCLLLSNPRD